MILCLCEGVSDRAVQQAIGQGHTTVRAIASACGAGRQCGSCICDVRRMLQNNPSVQTGAPNAAPRRAS